MAKPEITTEWTVCDSDAEWESVQGELFLPTTEEAPPARFGTRRLRWSVAAVALLVLVGAGAWLWHRAQRGLDEIDAELEAAVNLEVWAVQGEGDLALDLATGSQEGGSQEEELQEEELQGRIQRDHNLLKDAVAHATGGEGEPEVIADLEILRLHEDRAVVRVSIQIGDEAFRQTRLYHRSVEGWQQVSPDPFSLGEWRQLHTEHLSIGYFELDEAMVKEVAPRLEAFFVQAGQDFGDVAAISGGRFGLAITPDGEAANYALSTGGSLSNGAIHIVSPSFLLLPVAASDANALFQAAAYPLLYHFIQHALERTQSQSGNARAWIPLLAALRLWEFWQSDAPLAAWKDEIVALEIGGYGKLPEQYDEICHAYRTWNLSPSAMSIPLNCESKWRSPAATAQMLDTLNDLLAPGMYCTPVVGVACQDASEIGLTTVLDYVVATYGRIHLAALISALGEHARWETLIPAVFGVPMESFERGWQEYLVEYLR